MSQKTHPQRQQVIQGFVRVRDRDSRGTGGLDWASKATNTIIPDPTRFSNVFTRFLNLFLTFYLFFLTFYPIFS